MNEVTTESRKVTEKMHKYISFQHFEKLPVPQLILILVKSFFLIFKVNKLYVVFTDH